MLGRTSSSAQLHPSRSEDSPAQPSSEDASRAVDAAHDAAYRHVGATQSFEPCPVCLGTGRVDEPALEQIEAEEALAIVEAYSATDEEENR